MRATFYGLAAALQITGALGVAFLTQLAPNLWIFGAIGASIAIVMSAGWLGMSATAAERWPRLRARHLLLLFGLIAAIRGATLPGWYHMVWSIGVALIGGLMTYWMLPSGPGQARRRSLVPPPVRPPLGRREGD